MQRLKQAWLWYYRMCSLDWLDRLQQKNTDLAESVWLFLGSLALCILGWFYLNPNYPMYAKYGREPIPWSQREIPGMLILVGAAICAGLGIRFFYRSQNPSQRPNAPMKSANRYGSGRGTGKRARQRGSRQGRKRR